MTCSIDGCGQPATRLGWCEKHYTRFRRHGDPTYVVQRQPLPPSIRHARLKAQKRQWWRNNRGKVPIVVRVAP